jgi:hypothetical protein
MRTIEYYDSNYEEWFDIEWSEVVSGTLIHIYEPDGTPVSGLTGIYEMYTVSDSYTISGSEGPLWAVDVADNLGEPVSRPSQIM